MVGKLLGTLKCASMQLFTVKLHVWLRLSLHLLNSVNNRTSSFFEELRKTKSECNDLALLEYSLINNDTLTNLNVSNSCFNLSVIEELRIYEKQSILKCTLRNTLQTSNSNEEGLIKECDVTANVCESKKTIFWLLNVSF